MIGRRDYEKVTALAKPSHPDSWAGGRRSYLPQSVSSVVSDGGYELTFFQLQVKEHPTPTCWVDSGVGMLSPGASFSLRPSASLPVYWDHCQTGWPLQRQDNAIAVVVNCTSTSFQIQVQRKKASVCLLADPVSLLFSVSQWV